MSILKQVRDPDGVSCLSVIYKGGEVTAPTPSEAEIALIGQVLQDVILSENCTMLVTEAFIMKVYHG